jgi:uncharacterized protein
MNILIAGGTGLIGQALSEHLVHDGHEVKVLSRSKGKGLITWDVKAGIIESNDLGEIEVLINLSGAGIAERNWTNSRKKELLDSRVETTKVLFAHKEKMPKLKQYISASGITCYGNGLNENGYKESDDFGTDYISTLVQKWEAAADLFQNHVITAKIRTGIVLSAKGGALEKMLKPMRYGLGAPIASGRQILPWIHIDDLTALFVHVINKELSGAYNANAGNTSNKEFTRTLAGSIGKKIWLPAVPGFMMKFMLGEMATLLINGVHVSNEKIKKTGLTFKYPTLDLALTQLELK